MEARRMIDPTKVRLARLTQKVSGQVAYLAMKMRTSSPLLSVG